MAGRTVTTAEGLDPAIARRLVSSFCRHGASQCGFCTPGILCRLAGLGPQPTADKVETALLAHLCRCTGWRSIVDAACDPSPGPELPPDTADGDPRAAARRATLEGGVAQRTGAEAVLGRGGFADDAAPPGCLVAVPDATGGWALGNTLAEARAAAGHVQGRRSGQALRYPVDVPPGPWDLVLQTTWVEPAYLEPDSSWCRPGGQPAHPAGNGGAFGGKVASAAPAAARALADEHGSPVRVVFSREDVVRLGPKRPPLGAGLRSDGTGVIRVMATPGVAAAIQQTAPGVEVMEVSGVAGPPVSMSIRGAGWIEAAVLVAAAAALAEGTVPTSPGAGSASITDPSGGRAQASVTVDADGHPRNVVVTVSAGDPLDERVLRSYITGAAHMAVSWVCSEGIAVGEDGAVGDLTIRSFGVLPARHTPAITVHVEREAAPPVRVSDAAFGAVAAATWIAQGLPPRWPTRRGRAR